MKPRNKKAHTQHTAKTGTKTYQIVHADSGFVARIEIDHSLPTVESDMRSCVLFFTDGEEILAECDGDLTKAFLKRLAHPLLQTSDLVEGVIEAMGCIEGFPALDGSRGFKVTHCVTPMFHRSEFYVSEVTP